MADRTSVLFVCMGNICRSPLAEGLFLHLAAERGVADRFRVDSAGTGGWHVGNPADPRARAVAQHHGVHLPSRARQVTPEDWHDERGYDHIIAMDLENLEHLRRAGAPEGRVRLLRSFDPALAGKPDHHHEVPDPYYGEHDGFHEVFVMVRTACDGLLDELTGA